jgi:hypothetical protein
MLRKFKFSLSRHNLKAIYFTYILPLLEYACELWDGCTQREYNKIEQIQHFRVWDRFISKLDGNHFTLVEEEEN